LVYLGDAKNCPYGSQAADNILQYATQSVERLLERGCKMIVVACNTATAVAIKHLREKYPAVPFVGLEPAVKPACLTTRSGIVGVVATERSLQGEKFLNTLSRYGEGVEVIKVVGRGFVEAVESNSEFEPQTESLVRQAIEPIIAAGADVIVLGCTHYPFLREVIDKVIGDRVVRVIDSGEAVEKRVESLLDEFDMRANPDNEAQYEFLTFADEAYAERMRRKAFDE
jgi:glutamate racemase